MDGDKAICVNKLSCNDNTDFYCEFRHPMEETNMGYPNSNTRKTLRKKPPPEVVVEDVMLQEEIMPTPTVFQLPPRPTRIQIQNSMIDTSYGDMSYNDSYVDETMLSFDSPKPMGPKELPEYNLEPISTRQKYRQRLFQHISRSPVNQYAEELRIIKSNSLNNDKIHSYEDNNSSDDSNSYEDLVLNYKSRSPDNNLPYPTNDILADLELDFPFDSDKPGTDLLEIKDIPNLQFIPTTSAPRHSIDNYYLSSSDHPSLNKGSYHARSDSLPNSLSPHNYRNSNGIYPIDSIDTDINFIGHSPTFRYNRDHELQYPEDDYFTDLEEDDDTFDVNYSRSKHESIPTSYTDPDETLPTPIATYFDYSVLPDLPSPAKYQTDFKMSFLSKSPSKYASNSNLNSSSPRAKKFEDLPPVPLDLLHVPFTSASLVSQHLSACSNIWSLSNVFQWCLKLKTWLHDLFIHKREFKKALIKLFVFHRRDIPLDIVAKNVDQFVQTCMKAGALEYTSKEGDEVGVLLHDFVKVNGVLTDLTSCYGGIHGSRDLKLRCYSYYCHLNRIIDHEMQLKNTNINELVLGEDWAAHWKLTAQDLKNIDPNVSKRQSLLFDLFRFEQTFIQRARLFVEVVGPKFVMVAKSLLKASDIVLINNFEDDVLKPAQELVEIHEKVLFERLLKILISDGRFINRIVEIGELYFEWANEAQTPLLRYMSTVPMIEFLLSDPSLKDWIDQKVSSLDRAKQLKVNGHLLFLSTFNSRYQSLPLQLSDIRKLFDPQEPEYVSLTKAIDRLKRLGVKVNHMKVHADNIHALKRIHKQVVWKHNIRQPNINLGSDNRRFIHRGDIESKGDLRINTNTNHLILLDNYLLICEKVKNSKTGLGMYKVIEQPIPTEFLLVEEKDNHFFAINSLVNGIHSAPAINETQDLDAEPSTFPFKVRYAGRGRHDSHNFFTNTARERNDWIRYFREARSKICERTRKTDPYVLESIANTCFAYSNSLRISKLQVCAPFDPIYDIALDARNKLSRLGLVGDIETFHNLRNHIVFSKVQCLETFTYQGRQIYLLGLETGVYAFDQRNRWKKVLNGEDISKITVDVDINLVIILGNKHLRYYTLDLIMNVYYEKKRDITSVSLSNEPVLFFTWGKHREITMLFYAKKRVNSNATNFKLLIPETDNGGIFSAFRLVKKFYVQAECFGISIFNKSFAVHTNKGFEILELDKLIPRSIPDISNSDIKRSKEQTGLNCDLIKKAVLQTSLKPMGMFKLANNTEFLLVYSDFAVFTDKHGKLSRFSMLKFQLKAKSISFSNNNLLIVCDEVIEIWSISDFVNGTNKLIQVIVGKGITMLNEENLCFSLANPLVPGMQIITKLEPKILLS